VIYGTVVDEHGPVPELNVQVFLVGANRGAARLISACSVRTDREGRYRCDHLAQGAYLVAASFYGRSDGEGHLSLPAFTFYPDGTNIDRALYLRLGKEDIQDADFFLSASPSYRISGRIMDHPERPDLSLSTTAGSGIRYEVPIKARYLPTGAFVFDDVPPGSYEVSAEWIDNHEQLTSDAKVTVDSDLDDLLLWPLHLTDVAITVSSESQLTAEVPLTLEEVHTGLKSSANPIPGTRRYRFDQQMPGEYVLYADGDENMCISSVSLYGRDLSVPIRLDGEETHLAVEAQVGERCGSIRGQTASRTRSTLVLVAGGMNVVRVLDSDEFGRFELRGIPSGDYRIIAWHSLKNIPFRSASLLERIKDRAVTVEVTGGEYVETGIVPVQ
jgi:hypothetical protein